MQDPLLTIKPQFARMAIDMLPQILIIENQSYSMGWSAQLFIDCINKNYLCQVIKLDDVIAGYSIVQKIVDEHHILNICVAPNFLNKGLGRYQLKDIIKRAESAAMNRILLEVRASSKIARKLYMSAGFHIIGKRKGYYPHPDGREDAHVMELALS